MQQQAQQEFPEAASADASLLLWKPAQLSSLWVSWLWGSTEKLQGQQCLVLQLLALWKQLPQLLQLPSLAPHPLASGESVSGRPP